MQGREWLPGLREGNEVLRGASPVSRLWLDAVPHLCDEYRRPIGAVSTSTFDLVKKAVKHSPPTFLPGVPPIYDRPARAALHGELDLSSVRFAISGAMPLPVSTVQRWEEGVGWGATVEGYGITETSPVALGNPCRALSPSRIRGGSLPKPDQGCRP